MKMCLSADEVNPLCDECFAREKNLSPNEEFEPCEECKEALKHFCWCCMTTLRDEIVEDGCCKACRGTGLWAFGESYSNGVFDVRTHPTSSTFAGWEKHSFLLRFAARDSRSFIAFRRSGQERIFGNKFFGAFGFLFGRLPALYIESEITRENL